MSCMHCANPACEKVCPTGAIRKRAEDGVVLVDQSRCIGCRYCASACPFGAPQFEPGGTMIKCDMCPDRLAEGKQPACAATCPTGALHFGTLDELAELSAGKAAQRLAATTEPSLLISE